MRALALLVLLLVAAHAHSPRKGSHKTETSADDDDDSAAIKKYEATIATTTLPTPEKLEEDKICEYTREQSIECATRHGDLDHDGRINKTEIGLLRKKLLPWYVRTLAFFAAYTDEFLLWKCGDAHGYVTAQSLFDKKNLCLMHCRDWKKFMGFCKELDWG